MHQSRIQEDDRPSMYHKLSKKYYVVQPGDNLTKISWLFGIKVKDILHENDFMMDNKEHILSPGMSLEIKPK